MDRLHESPYFIKISSALLRAGLPSSIRDVLVLLHFRRNRETGQCNPSMERVAAELGLDRRTVLRAVTWLRRAGIVTGKTRGQKLFSYQIAPESDWPTLIRNMRQNVSRFEGPNVRQNVPQTCDKMSHEHATKCRTLPAVSITEKKTEKNKEKRERACVASDVVGEPNGGSAAHAHASPPSALKTEPEPAAPEPDLAQRAERQTRKLFKYLAKSYPRLGPPQRAREVLAGLLLASDAPESLAERIGDSFLEWHQFWLEDQQLKNPRFVPYLWAWLKDGDWEYPPTEAQIELQRKAPKRALSFEEKLERAQGRNGQ